MHTNVTLAVPQDFLVGIGPLVLGLGIAAALIIAVSIGIRVRSREPAPPTREEQPKLPDSGPVEVEYGHPEPDELEQRDPADRLLPHEIGSPGGIRRSRGREDESGGESRT